LRFTSIGDEGEDADLDVPKVYEPINSFQQLSDKLQTYLEQYNETVRGAKLDLVFFKVSLDCQQHFDLLDDHRLVIWLNLFTNKS
jgi:hypothetical protein